MVKITKTKWMRPHELAALLGISKQNLNNYIGRNKIERKYDKFGFALVRGT